MILSIKKGKAMKKILSLILTLSFVLILVGCGNSSIDIIKKDGKKYIVLPESKQEVHCYEMYEAYLDEVDAGLLKAAEKKITKEALEYADKVVFGLVESDGELFLYTEVIVELDPSETTDEECGDHEHKMFKERITK